MFPIQVFQPYVSNLLIMFLMSCYCFETYVFISNRNFLYPKHKFLFSIVFLCFQSTTFGFFCFQCMFPNYILSLTSVVKIDLVIIFLRKSDFGGSKSDAEPINLYKSKSERKEESLVSTILDYSPEIISTSTN